LFDGIHYLVDAGLRAGVEVLSHEYYMWQGLRILGQARAVQIASDVAAAVTDKDPNTDIFRRGHGDAGTRRPFFFTASPYLHFTGSVVCIPPI
jgi:hypothetical protein